MNVSLISLPIVEGDPKANLAKMELLLCDSLKHDPDLVCFPEMSVVTDGYPWGRYSHLAEPIPGKYSGFFCRLAKKHNIHIALGLMEPEGNDLYSSAILVDPNGDILIKHRKVREGGPYSCGKTFDICQADFGTVMFAVCADVWSPKLISSIKKHKPQYVIVPTDMSGEKNELGLINFDRQPDGWEEQKKRYMEISKVADSKVLVVNCYCKDTSEYCAAFGGSYVFDNGIELPSLDLQPGQWRQPAEEPIYNFII